MGKILLPLKPAFLDDFSVERLLTNCLEENARRMSQFDPQLLQPKLLPGIAQVALFGLRRLPKRSLTLGRKSLLRTMKAVVLDKVGGVDVLTVRQVPTPEPGENDVLVQIKLAGVNYADLLARQGLYNWVNKPPYILGLESSGVVEAIGQNVRRFKVGDRVVVGSKNGNYAEWIVQPEDWLLPAPDTLDFAELACLCGNWATAWTALAEMARVRSGKLR